MKLSISHPISAERERVFDALVDPAVLQQCIPGCESLVATGPDTYEASMKVGVAALTGSYRGTASISDKQRPASLRLGFEGKGAPGFVRGTASIALSAEPDATLVACDADVQVGGLLASVGSRLVEATARKLARDFFDQLTKQLTR